MPSAPNARLVYRLRVRNPADDADLLVVTSLPEGYAVPGTQPGAHPYIAEPPATEGATIDPVTGQRTVGSTSVRVIDEARKRPPYGWRLVVYETTDSPNAGGCAIGECEFLLDGVNGATGGTAIADYYGYVLFPSNAFNGGVYDALDAWGTDIPGPHSLGYIKPEPWDCDAVRLQNRMTYPTQAPTRFAVQHSDGAGGWMTYVSPVTGAEWIVEVAPHSWADGVPRLFPRPA